tara:strand:+ start:2599 stop:2706 length:108 start_codon:yes stop_codon:yes gene_type:complete
LPGTWSSSERGVPVANGVAGVAGVAGADWKDSERM